MPSKHMSLPKTKLNFVVVKTPVKLCRRVGYYSVLYIILYIYNNIRMILNTSRYQQYMGNYPNIPSSPRTTNSPGVFGSGAAIPTLSAGFMELCCVCPWCTATHPIQRNAIFSHPGFVKIIMEPTPTSTFTASQRSRKIHEDPGNIHEQPQKSMEIHEKSMKHQWTSSRII